METIKEFLNSKGFNHLSFVVVICSVTIGIILLGVVVDIENNEQRYFTCGREGKKKDSFQTTKCFVEYQAKTTKGFPLYGFVLLNFLLVTIVCFCYSQSVQSTLKDLECQDPEMQTNQSSRRLYRRYCIQLVVRFTLGMTFLVLQWGIFYPPSFPSKYACDLSSIRQAKRTNASSDATNITRSLYDCYNPQADKKTFWNSIVFTVNVVLTVFILLELLYVTRKARVSNNFTEDLEFFNFYLQNKDPKVIERYLAEMKKNIKKNTKFYEPLLSIIPGEKRKWLELDTIYTNLIMYPGRARHVFTGKRHEIYEGYLRSQENYKTINKIEGIFTPEPGNPQERPLSIMIVGRPGIGKSLLCLKILRDWACDQTFNEETEARQCFEFVCLFKFRHFNSDEKMNLQQLLGRCQFSRAFPNEVYNWILNHPEKVLLIFDGLDEFGKKENIIKEEEFGSNPAEIMPFSALYSKLTLGKLLEGATVVTTSRPTALTYVSFPNKDFDRTLEALGFNPEQTEKYVKSFCQGDSEIQQRMIWNHIRSNANLLSLCYIPVNCHIVCFSLQERPKRTDVDYLPTTLTEIYEDALRIIVCKHNPRYRWSVPEQEELLSSSHFAPEVETSLNSLGKIAYEGIEENRLIFESNEIKGHEECGLLHRLPDEWVAGSTRKKNQYCFLHLTIQELLAARYIIAQLMGGNLKEELQSWISEHLHEGKWEVVMQFVAGLLHRHVDHTPIIKLFIKNLPMPITSANVKTTWVPLKQSGLVIQLFKCIFEISRGSKHEWKSLLAETLSVVDKINLNASSLTDADLTTIVFVLQELNSIESLSLYNNHITSIGCSEICKLLTVTGSSDMHDINKCKLTTLVIRMNQIGDDGLEFLSKALATNECKLTRLEIGLNQIGDDGLKHLSAALATNECKLTTLYISDNQIGDDGLKHLSAALAKNECKLTTLYMSGNQIGDDGLKHLCDALAENECKLTTLAIDSNQIGDDGLENLSEALAKNECKLTTLYIGDNQIAEDGLKHLSAALAKNECKLTTLGIDSHQIGDGGLEHLSAALAKNECKLTTLEIHYNQIGDGELEHLSEALATNECKLTRLVIHPNQIGNGRLKQLSDALARKGCKLIC